MRGRVSNTDHAYTCPNPREGTETMKRIIAQNIMQGGSARAPALVNRIAAHDPDVIVITEFRANNIDRLGSALETCGYDHFAHFADDDKWNGTFVASKTPVAVDDASPIGASRRPNHLLRVRFDGLDLIAAYIPQHRAVDTKSYFDRLIELSTAGDVLIIGDLNVDDPDFDGFGYRFAYRHWYAELLATGLIDCYRREHHVPTVTWKHHRGSREGFRIDHALASHGVADRVAGVSYDHSVRLDNTSDHSMLIVDMIA